MRSGVLTGGKIQGIDNDNEKHFFGENNVGYNVINI